MNKVDKDSKMKASVIWAGVKTSQSGFNLIELMVTVAIVGILFGIAIPSYQNYTIKARRGQATGCLLELSQALERRYAGSSTYVGDLPTAACITSLSGYYSFTPTKLIDKNSYTLKAAPTSLQPDWLCGSFTYNNAGLKAMEASAAGKTGTVAECW